jgi:hypothetical protein
MAENEMDGLIAIFFFLIAQNGQYHKKVCLQFIQTQESFCNLTTT